MHDTSRSSFIVAVDPGTPPAGLEGCVVAIGNFDGVHRGHQAVVRRARALADELGRPCAVLTFEPHPADVFANRSTMFRLTPPTAKALALSRLGTAHGMIVQSFDQAFASMTASDFVNEILARRLGISAAVVGYDFHFGSNRTGTPAFLTETGLARGFAVAIIDKILADDRGTLEAVSSTAIRGLLEQGNVRHAALLLGRDHFVLGPVVAGRQLGRTLGFPTANIALDPSCRLAYGIYAVRVRIGTDIVAGVASYGRRPTFDNGPPLLESYLFDFNRDIYGETIEVTFVDWIRGEEKFATVEALVERMRLDCDAARQCLAATV